MNTINPELPPREPTEAETFPPMRSPTEGEKTSDPESTVDYRNHNLVAALFSDHAEAAKAVEALKNESHYAPSAIRLTRRPENLDRSVHSLSSVNATEAIRSRVVKLSLLGAMIGGAAAALTHRRASSTETALARLGVGLLAGGAAGALLGVWQNRAANFTHAESEVLVKVRSGDLSESASILEQHRGTLKTNTGAPFSVLHAQS